MTVYLGMCLFLRKMFENDSFNYILDYKTLHFAKLRHTLWVPDQASTSLRVVPNIKAEDYEQKPCYIVIWPGENFGSEILDYLSKSKYKHRMNPTNDLILRFIYQAVDRRLPKLYVNFCQYPFNAEEIYSRLIWLRGRVNLHLDRKDLCLDPHPKQVIEPLLHLVQKYRNDEKSAYLYDFKYRHFMLPRKGSERCEKIRLGNVSMIVQSRFLSYFSIPASFIDYVANDLFLGVLHQDRNFPKSSVIAGEYYGKKLYIDMKAGRKMMYYVEKGTYFIDEPVDERDYMYHQSYRVTGSYTRMYNKEHLDPDYFAVRITQEFIRKVYEGEETIDVMEIYRTKGCLQNNSSQETAFEAMRVIVKMGSITRTFYIVPEEESRMRRLPAMRGEIIPGKVTLCREKKDLQNYICTTGGLTEEPFDVLNEQIDSLMVLYFHILKFKPFEIKSSFHDLVIKTNTVDDMQEFDCYAYQDRY